MTDEPKVKYYALADIQPGPNARTEFDEVELKELADSLIETRSPLQPLVGVALEGGKVELIAGERRWRAAHLTEIKRLPVMLRERPSHKDWLKWNLIENLQRVQLRPIETARRVKEMLELVNDDGQAVFSLRGLAEEIGKDHRYINWYMNVLKAPEKLQKLVDAGEVGLEVGSIIGALPVECHDEALKQMVLRLMGPMKRDEARRYAAENFRRDLRKAGFNKEDPTLVKDLPACRECPHWGGNREDLEGKSRENVCLNPPCFERKQLAASEIVKRHAEQRGTRVLDQSRCAKIFGAHDNQLRADAPFVELEKKPDLGLLKDKSTKVPTWGKILEETKAEVVVAFDADGKARTLVDKAVALAAARSSEFKEAFESKGSLVIETTEQTAVNEAVKKAGKAEAQRLLIEYGGKLMEALSGDWNDGMRVVMLNLILARCTQPDDKRLLCQILQPDLKKVNDPDKTLSDLVAKFAKPEQMWSLMVMAMVARPLRFQGFESAEVRSLGVVSEFDAEGTAKAIAKMVGAAEKKEAEHQEQLKAAPANELPEEKAKRVNRLRVAKTRSKKK